MRIKRTTLIHWSIMAFCLILIWITQSVPAWGEGYARFVYPYIYRVLSPVSGIFPFSVGDLFIFLSLLGIIVYPIVGRIRKIRWIKILQHIIQYLVWVYIWFYLAWGLNYSQQSFLQRAQVPYIAYTPEIFQDFVNDYIENLNTTFDSVPETNKSVIHEEIIYEYKQNSRELAIHTPQGKPKVKTMMFTPLISKMAITGYMGPFFCEFNVNGDLLPYQYATTYAHEMAHLLGITSEAEANFYAYQVCTRSENQFIKFCGYFSVLNHVLGNARRLYTEEEYKELFQRINPKIIELARFHQQYWSDKYSPLIGDIQDWMYNLYLKGNKISSGTKNYSEVIGLLISWREYNKRDNFTTEDAEGTEF
ncbi:DUF3810 domain-containing protein [Bacteroides sp. 224]|uniref:DUF3810 domain-containing protein n=1 Tax=Bacteroides sp. 224 TaxID=2302936 RepID=UPI0013D7B780|nr:DUF3810 domain-containing protein [Bacteroides sp. 224]NDV65334.1 DUF3810 domain-containing protein [Bacteroides sp. 224]